MCCFANEPRLWKWSTRLRRRLRGWWRLRRRLREPIRTRRPVFMVVDPPSPQGSLNHTSTNQQDLGRRLTLHDDRVDSSPGFLFSSTFGPFHATFITRHSVLFNWLHPISVRLIDLQVSHRERSLVLSTTLGTGLSSESKIDDFHQACDYKQR